MKYPDSMLFIAVVAAGEQWRSAAEGDRVAMRKIGCRRIVVYGVAYLWRAPRRPGRMDWDGNTAFTVTVQGEDRRGSALSIHFPQRHPAVARVWGSPIVSVVTSQVAAAIRRAIAAGWLPAEQGSGFAVAGEAQEAEPGAAPDPAM
jgi:hypothetical protein